LSDSSSSQQQRRSTEVAAIQIWERLLASNPSYPDRPKVQQQLDQVKREIGIGS
jgi:hypothetical protein